MGEEIKKFFAVKWPGTPIVDAPENWQLPINIIKDDVDQGKPRDADHCAFAVACERQFGSKHAVFTRNLAYLDLIIGEKEAERLGVPVGSRIVYRFRLPAKTRQSIAEFDTKGTTPAGGFVINGVTAGQTMASMRERRERLAYKVKPVKKPYGKRKDALTLDGVRYGGGILKFKEAK